MLEVVPCLLGNSRFVVAHGLVKVIAYLADREVGRSTGHIERVLYGQVPVVVNIQFHFRAEPRLGDVERSSQSDSEVGDGEGQWVCHAGEHVRGVARSCRDADGWGYSGA